MKKIILGCAAVLLSLGLLAGCNNKEDEPPIEEAVVITVDSSASVIVGESLSLTYTVSPEKAEVVAASDNEDIVTAVAQEGTLYLEGVAEGSAIVTLVGTYEGYASANKNINVSVITKEEEDAEPGIPDTGGDEGGEDETAVKLTIENTLSLTLPEQGGQAEAQKIEYTVDPTEEAGTIVDMVAADEESTIKLQNLEDGWYVTPVAEGETTISVTAEYTSDEGVEYTPAEATIAVTVSEYTEPEPDPVFESYTITVNLQTAGGEAFPDPGNDYSVWIQSSYDGTDGDHWGNANEMTYVGSGVYKYVYTSVPGWASGDAGYETNIIAGHESEPKWENFNATAITLKDTTSLTGEITDEFTIKSVIGDTWEEIFPPETEDETTFYLVLVDGSKGAETTNTSAELDVWFHTSDSTLCWNGANYCQGTQTTDSTGVRAWYSKLGTTNVNHNDWFNASCNNAGINFGGNLTIPSNANGIPVFVVGGWCSDDWANGSSYWNPVDGTTQVWETLSADQTIQQFITATDLNSVIGNSGD